MEYVIMYFYDKRKFTLKGAVLRAGSVSKFIFAFSAAFGSAVSNDLGFLVIIGLAVMTAYLSWGAGLKDIVMWAILSPAIVRDIIRRRCITF